MTELNDAMVEAGLTELRQHGYGAETEHGRRAFRKALTAAIAIQPEAARAKIVEECAEAAGMAAWKHTGEDQYSRGMDAGARHQVQACVDAIRALTLPAPPPKVTI